MNNSGFNKYGGGFDPNKLGRYLSEVESEKAKIANQFHIEERKDVETTATIFEARLKRIEDKIDMLLSVFNINR